MTLRWARNVIIVPKSKLISPSRPILLSDLNLVNSECLLDIFLGHVEFWKATYGLSIWWGPGKAFIYSTNIQ